MARDERRRRFFSSIEPFDWRVRCAATRARAGGGGASIWAHGLMVNPGTRTVLTKLVTELDWTIPVDTSIAAWMLCNNLSKTSIRVFGCSLLCIDCGTTVVPQQNWVA